jgi:hypothetical protein
MIINREQLKEVFGEDLYGGCQIHSRFSYKFFKKKVNPLGNIVSFIAPMEVTANLIDLEDSLNKDYIYSDLAMNFIMEIPNKDIWGGVLFQRLLNAQVGSLLCSKYLNTEGFVDGDDIMVGSDDNAKKASVSIAAEKNGAVLIHLGININAGKRAPDFAYSTNLTEHQALEFMTDVESIFNNILNDVFVATTKIVV